MTTNPIHIIHRFVGAFSCRGVRDDIDKEDDQESYFRWLEENPNAGLPITDEDEEDRELQYDDDGKNHLFDLC